jgi:hypothetical protein
LSRHTPESCTGVEATRARHSAVASKDPACSNKSGNPSGFDSSFAQDFSPDTEQVEETFGKDTAAKSAAYASDEIYVENMWGELRKATPPPSGQALSYGITARPVSQVDKKLKGTPRTSHYADTLTSIHEKALPKGCLGNIHTPHTILNCRREALALLHVGPCHLEQSSMNSFHLEQKSWTPQGFTTNPINTVLITGVFYTRFNRAGYLDIKWQTKIETCINICQWYIGYTPPAGAAYISRYALKAYQEHSGFGSSERLGKHTDKIGRTITAPLIYLHLLP